MKLKTFRDLVRKRMSTGLAFVSIELKGGDVLYADNGEHFSSIRGVYLERNGVEIGRVYLRDIKKVY
jgi:hypothetical protein